MNPVDPSISSCAPAHAAALASATRRRRSEEALRTDHLLGDLKSRAISGGVVTVLAQFLRFGLYMATAVVLARMLTPADFGLVAMVNALTSFLRMFRDAGLSTATIQKQEITHSQVSNLFWINVSITSALTFLLMAVAPGVAWFYGDSRVTAITIILALTFVLSGLTVQHIAILTRQMRFRAIALIDIGGIVAGLAAGIIMARSGWGYWSLVGSQLAISITEVALTWSISPWRPGLPTAKSGTRAMLNFGASLTVSNFMRRVAQGADQLLIGRFFGAEPLGLYTRALALLMRPLDQFITPFDTIFIPMLSRLQQQPERYRQAFLQAFGTIALFSFPMAAVLLALSEPIVLALLGVRWAAVVPIFAALSLAALHIPLGYATMWLLTTQGRSRDVLLAGLMFSVVSVISCFAGIAWGVLGVAVAYSVGGVLVRLPVQYHITGRSGAVSTSDLWLVTFRYLPLWPAVFAATYVTYRVLKAEHPLIQIAAALPAGLLAAAAVIAIVPTYRAAAAGFIHAIRAKVTRKVNASSNE